MRAARLLLQARGVIKYVLRAASTKKYGCRVVSKLSRGNLEPIPEFTDSHLCLVGDDVKLRQVALCELQCGLLGALDAQGDPKLSNLGRSFKWYYDQKIISFFSSDSESVFA